MDSRDEEFIHEPYEFPEEDHEHCDYSEFDTESLADMWAETVPVPIPFQDKLEQMKLSGAYRDAAWFVDLFNPYLERYTANVYTGVETGRTWITQKQRLKFRSLQGAIDGTYQLGWYSSVATPVVGIDIDDHEYGGWKPGKREPLPELAEQYDKVVRSFPVLPSVVVLSPHGLHVYFLLSRPMHVRHLQTLTRSKLSGLPVELKPTPSTTLRVPARKWMLAPMSLTRLYPTPDSRIEWTSIPVYRREVLFGSDWREQLRHSDFDREAGRERRKRRPMSRPAGLAPATHPSLRDVEDLILPFQNNRTNEQVFKLVVACRTEGLSLEQTIDRALWWLENSPRYTGPLNDDPEALEQKVRYIYGAGSSKGRPTAERVDVSEYSETIGSIVACHPFVPQRTKAVRRFLENLARTKKRHDLIADSKSLTRYEDDKYEYYRLNRARGAYPLPSKTLKAWNTNYTSILEWLLDIGILEEDGRGYSPLRHVCKHYFIHINPPSASHDTDEDFDDSVYV